MSNTAAVGKINQERHIKLAMQSGSPRGIEIKITTNVWSIIVRFISVVGKVKYERILIAIELDDLADNRVVVMGCVVVVCHFLSLFFGQFGTVIIIGIEYGTIFGETLIGVYVLAPEVEEDEVERVAFDFGPLAFVFFDEAFIVSVYLGITM